MQNFNKQQPKPKINIPKTPQQLFIKKTDDDKQHQHQHQPQIHLEQLKPIKTVKYLDELYSATFLDDYFR
jgi:capsule polysaccharide export protein KpsC/LpsZ